MGSLGSVLKSPGRSWGGHGGGLGAAGELSGRLWELLWELLANIYRSWEVFWGGFGCLWGALLASGCESENIEKTAYFVVFCCISKL